MKTINQVMLDNVDNFIRNPDDGFDVIFSIVRSIEKNECRDLLIYLDKVLNTYLLQDEEKLRVENIHFEFINNEAHINLIAEFIVIKFFIISREREREREREGVSFLSKIENKIAESVKVRIPSGRKGKKAIMINNELREYLADLYKFYSLSGSDLEYGPNALFNLLPNSFKYLTEIFYRLPYAVSIEELANVQSYCLLNLNEFEKIQNLELDNKFIIKNIENVIVFDLRKTTFQEFNFLRLNEYNASSETIFKRLILLSIGRDNVNGFETSKKLESIRDNYYIEKNNEYFSSYVLTQYEYLKLTKQGSGNISNVLFYGGDALAAFDIFVDVVSKYEQLYELRSYKMLSIYSLAFNVEIKDIILSSIFDSHLSILDKDTFDAIQDLDPELIQQLKSNLDIILINVLRSDWVKEIRRKFPQCTAFILNDRALSCKKLLDEIKKEFPLCSFYTWGSAKVRTNDHVLILDYRDEGKFPFFLKENIFENKFLKAKTTSAFFLSLFFEKKYKWANYKMMIQKYNNLDHDIRRKYFNWIGLQHMVKNTKPFAEEIDNTNYEEEIKFINYESRYYVVTFEDMKKERIIASQMILVKSAFENNICAIRMDELMELSSTIDEIFLQSFDKFPSLFENIYELKKDESESVLQNIRSTYNLNYEEPEKIWKQLLIRKTEASSVVEVYSELCLMISHVGEKFVSLDTFSKNWLNLKSDLLIPRKKIIFINICEYLGLKDNAYLRIMLRIRNTRRKSSYDNTVVSNRLISLLVNHGCFLEDANYRDLLDKYKKIYLATIDFDEIGINGGSLVEELSALVELLKPFIKLKKIKNFVLDQ